MLNTLLDGKNWFPVVIPLTACVALAFLTVACRRRLHIVTIAGGTIGVFIGLYVGVMATGHLFAITTKMMLGILPPRIDPWFALPFGFAMAIPGYLIAWLAGRSICRPRSVGAVG